MMELHPSIREELGRVVRKAWVDYCQETGDTKPSHIAPWEELSEWDQEADRRIGTVVYEYVTARLCSTGNLKDEPPKGYELPAGHYFVRHTRGDDDLHVVQTDAANPSEDDIDRITTRCGIPAPHRGWVDMRRATLPVNYYPICVECEP